MRLIKFNEIPEDGLSLNLNALDLGPLWDDVLTLSMKVQIHAVSGGCTLIGSVISKLILTCSFCMKKFEYPLKEDFSDLVLLDKGDVVNDNSSDMFVKMVSEPLVDLRLLSREIINLSIPMQVACVNGCKGLCSSCGVNLNYEECACESLEIENPFSILKSIDM